jgi:hypothetical protein
MAKDINSLKDKITKTKELLTQSFAELEALGDLAADGWGDISRVLPGQLTKNMQTIANIVTGSGQESLSNLMEYLNNLPSKAYEENGNNTTVDKMKQMAVSSSNEPSGADVSNLGTGAPEPGSAIASQRESVGLDQFLKSNSKKNYNSSISGLDLSRLGEAGLGADKEGLPQLKELMADIPNKPQAIKETIQRAEKTLAETESSVNLNDFVRASVRTENKVGGFTFDQLREGGLGVDDSFMKSMKGLMQEKNDTKGILNQIAGKVQAAQHDRSLEEADLDIEGLGSEMNWSKLAEASGSIDNIPSMGDLSGMTLRDPLADIMSGNIREAEPTHLGGRLG